MIKSFNGKRPKVAPSAFVSEAAYVVGDVEIGAHSSVWPGAVIRGDFGRIAIGGRTCVEDNCVIHGAGDVSIGNGVIIGHGAVVHCARIGDHVLVGNNATLLDGAEIGDFCIVGAGSLVPPGMKIMDESLALGVPIRIEKPITARQKDRLIKGAEIYDELAQRYKRQGL